MCFLLKKSFQPHQESYSLIAAYIKNQPDGAFVVIAEDKTSLIQHLCLPVAN